MKKTLKNIELYPYHVIVLVTICTIVSIFVFGFFNAPDAVADVPCFVDDCSGSSVDLCHGGQPDFSCVDGVGV